MRFRLPDEEEGEEANELTGGEGRAGQVRAKSEANSEPKVEREEEERPEQGEGSMKDEQVDGQHHQATEHVKSEEGRNSQTQTPRISINTFGQMTHEALVLIAIGMDKQIDNLKWKIAVVRGQLKTRKARAQCAKRKCTRRQKTIDKANKDLIHARSQNQLKLGKMERYFSPRGGLMLDVMRNVCSTAAFRIGMALRTDASHVAVLRWEGIAAECLLASSRSFYSTNELRVHQTIAAGEPRRWGIHTARGDATNTKCLHHERLRTFQLWTTYGRLGDENSFSKMNWGDVMRVSDSTAKGTHGMSLKQINSLGGTTWVDIRKRWDEIKVGFDDAKLREYPIEAFVLTTDAGPDEKATRNHVGAMLGEIPTCLYFSYNCLIHQAHLIQKHLLKRGDAMLKLLGADIGNTTYFGGLATTMNCVRDVHIQAKNCWELEYGAEDALYHWSRSAPKCLIGRWGAVARCEEWFLSKPEAKLLNVLTEVLAKKEEERRKSSCGPER